MGRRMTEGRKLRRRLDAALAAEASRLGRTLVWDDRELEYLALAEGAADRRADLLALLAAEQAGAAGTALIVKLNTEIRAQDRALVDLLGRIHIGEGPAKSVRHQKAVQVRWDRQREQEATGGA
ncbi:hypothetical protein FK529_04695 [Tsukamurella asaccharolytica]|uniref:Uncharacterized protein n=1 Tax=Tsukamurella asaccharolytica TaxID=2592067 RepID=A0A5C5REY0_9ACTN|nr:hypothetical protein [Tsukamurella asaccharolytica]TWS20645.1 hypothetical protein FK529_04695 [Tsukamurella asaccharolytica]